MIIAIDFDGTCVTHEFPKVGKDIGAVPVLKELVNNGHQLILWTMRSDSDNVNTTSPEIHNESGKYLQDAIDWFNIHQIPLFGIQCNPEQRTWTTSPKAYAQLYIDDAALGCPLLHGNFGENGEGFYFDRPHVDWDEVRNQLIRKGILANTGAQASHYC